METRSFAAWATGFVLLAALIGVISLQLPAYYLEKAEAVLNEKNGASALVAKYRRTSYPEVEKRQASKHNIILILTDDQHYATLDYMPFLQKFMSERGIRFTRAFATNPECCPFRASLLAGGFDTHETGVKSNARANGSLQNLDESRTIPVYLQSVGMKTGFVGKYMHGYRPGYVPPGWDRFVANEDGGMLHDYWNLYNITYGKSDFSAAKGMVRFKSKPKKKYITTFQTDEALSFIDQHKDERFFLFLSYYAPHAPFIAEHAEDSDVTSSLNIACTSPSEINLRPQWVQTAAQFVEKNRSLYGRCAEIQLRGQASLLQSVDRNIKRITDRLARHDLMKETVIFFLSDNGIMLGNDALFADKGMPYESVIRVPMLVYHPEITSPKLIDSLVAANLDAAASIFDVAGVDAPTEGQSVFDIVRGASWKRSKVLIENYGYLDWHRRRRGLDMGHVIWSGYRTKDWKYVEYTTGEAELYDLAADPDEQVNLVGEEDRKELIEGFRNSLKKERGLAIATSELPEGFVGRAYDFPLEAWGGVTPYRWTMSAEGADSGLTIDRNTGRITGIPDEAGKFMVEISVKDSGRAKHAMRPERFSWRYALEIVKPIED